jgi:hypothetical protein
LQAVLVRRVLVGREYRLESGLLSRIRQLAAAERMPAKLDIVCDIMPGQQIAEVFSKVLVAQDFQAVWAGARTFSLAS